MKANLKKYNILFLTSGVPDCEYSFTRMENIFPEAKLDAKFVKSLRDPVTQRD